MPRALFDDRQHAGGLLAERLASGVYRDPLVLGLPRGGVPIAAAIALRLGAALDVLLVRKIGVPWQEELAMGAVVDGAAHRIVRNQEVIDGLGISEADFDAGVTRELALIERRRRQWLASRTPQPITGRTVIVADDGIATGATMRVALEAVRSRRPCELIAAAPVAPVDVVRELRGIADTVMVLEVPENFGAVGQYYRDFTPVEDDDVADLLRT